MGDIHVIITGNICAGKSFLIEHLKNSLPNKINDGEINYLDESMTDFEAILPDTKK